MALVDSAIAKVSEANGVFETGEEYDTDLEDEKYPQCTTLPPDDRPRVIYIRACKKYRITPSSSFLRGMKSRVVNLNYQNLGPYGAKAVALSLVMNGHVTELHMCGNKVGKTGTKYIIDMLRENETISHLNLADNDLQSYGAELLCEMLNDNDNIININVSGNNFKSTDSHVFHTMMSNYRCTLKELDLSHNDFGEVGGKLLGEAIGNNDSIETLNLSWNRLGPIGAKAIAAGLQENISIKYLDVSWNGMEDHGCELIASAITVNDIMISLNLSSNRIGPLALGAILKSVTKCKSLKTLDVSQNPITFEGPVIAVQIVHENPECGLEMLQFRDMCVPRQFLPILMKINEIKPNFRVKHGGYVNGSDILHHSMEQRHESVINDPMMRLLEYTHEKKLRLADLFFQFDTDRNMTISENEFITGIKRAGIPMTDTQIQELISKLDVDEDGEIDFGEMKLGEAKYLRRMEKVGVDLPFTSPNPPSRQGSKMSSRPNSSTNISSRPSSKTNTPTSRPVSKTSRPKSNRSASRAMSSQNNRSLSRANLDDEDNNSVSITSSTDTSKTDKMDADEVEHVTSERQMIET